MITTTPATRHRLPAAFRQYLRNATSHQTPCEQCIEGDEAHEYAYGIYHVFSTSRVGLLHEVQLNVEGVTRPSCTCEHGTNKSPHAPLRCKHYLYAREKHLERYGEILLPQPGDHQAWHVVVRVVWSNGVELFGNDEAARSDVVGARRVEEEEIWDTDPGDEQPERHAAAEAWPSPSSGPYLYPLSLPAIWEASKPRQSPADCGLTRLFESALVD